jgi:NTP pyrophosphatase (non-canonical NTP hydrolase)
MTRDEVFALIEQERRRQAEQWNQHDHQWGFGDCSSGQVDQTVKAAVLAEECGEVARAVLEVDMRGLRDELVQVAAVAVAWLEGMP